MSATARKDSGWDSRSAETSHANSAGTSAWKGPAPAGAVSKSSSAANVLVVEDDKSARRALKLILKAQGCAVAEAGTVAEAVGALAQRPDWVLLDLMLPDGCGTEVLDRVRRDAYGCKVCVITGCGPDKLEEVRAMGPELVLKKPVDVQLLLAALTA